MVMHVRIMLAIFIFRFLSSSKNVLSRALYELQRYKHAVTVFEQAIRLNPGDAFVHLDMSYALSKLRHFEEALVHCEQAIQMYPEFAAAYHHKGCLLREFGRFEEAQKAFTRAKQLGF